MPNSQQPATWLSPNYLVPWHTLLPSQLPGTSTLFMSLQLLHFHGALRLWLDFTVRVLLQWRACHQSSPKTTLSIMHDMPRGARQEMQPPTAALHAPALPGHLITTLGRHMWHFSIMELPIVSTQVRERHPDEADRCSRLFYLGQILGVYCCGRTLQPTSTLSQRIMGLRRWPRHFIATTADWSSPRAKNFSNKPYL